MIKHIKRQGGNQLFSVLNLVDRTLLILSDSIFAGSFNKPPIPTPDSHLLITTGSLLIDWRNLLIEISGQFCHFSGLD